MCSWGCNKAYESLAPSHVHTLWSHSWPNWLATPTSPLPLSGWDDRGREPGERRKRRVVFYWLFSRCGLSVFLAGMCCTYSSWIETQGVFLYPKMNPLQPHDTSVARGLHRARPMSAGQFFSNGDAHHHTVVFIQSEACCPLISLRPV